MTNDFHQNNLKKKKSPFCYPVAKRCQLCPHPLTQQGKQLDFQPGRIREGAKQARAVPLRQDRQQGRQQLDTWACFPQDFYAFYGTKE